MKRFLFLTTGAGEYSILKPFIRYVQSKGHKAILLASDNVLPIIKAEHPSDIDIEIFSSKETNGLISRVHTLCDFYQIDVFVMKPSRGYLAQIPKPSNVKLVVTVETNLQFRGVGNSYRLDKILPEWVDIYALCWHPEVHKRALYSHYGIETLKDYPQLDSKVHAIGCMPSQPVKKTDVRNEYSFSYFGSGSNFNEGILPRLVTAYFNIEKKKRLFSVSRDVVTGNYPRLDVAPMVDNYDAVIGNAYEAFLHEGYGSINKCIANQVPIMSFCADTQIKQMEIQPLADLGLVYKCDKKGDVHHHIEKFRIMRTEIKAKQKKYAMNGEVNLYKLIMDRL